VQTVEFLGFLSFWRTLLTALGDRFAPSQERGPTMTIAPVADLHSFFSSAVRQACARCSFGADRDIEGYLSALLVDRAARVPSELSIVLALDSALEEHPSVRGAALQSVGDHALYAHGFLGVPPQDEAVYVHCGTVAFSHAAMYATKNAALFRALATNFLVLSDVLTEVAVAQSLGAQTCDLVRLYDAWKRSKSPSALDAMTSAGLFPSDRNAGDA
jgi:hypothetical protein